MHIHELQEMSPQDPRETEIGDMMIDVGIVAAGLSIIFLIVLIAPFRIKIVEQNLEAFLLACGIVAITLAGFALIPGIETGWRTSIVAEALTDPLMLADFYGIPIGIAQMVLLVGLINYWWHKSIHRAIIKMTDMLSFKAMTFILIVGLGLLSSVISTIIASLILVEMVNAMPLSRSSKVHLVVIACFSIGLGAALTPLGEPLSTVAISKLSGEPYHAQFDYLLKLLGVYVFPGIIAYGLLGVFFVGKEEEMEGKVKAEVYRETTGDVFMRAVKVYVFIMALVFLGDGFKILILEYFTRVPPEALYWVNMLSAVLDNATLTAAEIGPMLSVLQIKAALMGLLVAGGMLIPGNIPNIISAGKLRITSKEWAKTGIPLGLASMIVYFVVIFVLKI